MTDFLENRECRYIIIRADRQQRPEESINVHFPAYFIYFIDDEPTWFFDKGPNSKSSYKEHYEDIESRFKKARPFGNSVYLLVWRFGALTEQLHESRSPPSAHDAAITGQS